jgi:alginate O-acetyltransferase complex protein AlgI
MLFNSPIFIFLFLPVAYFMFWALRTKRSRYVWLTLTGYVFYAAWNPKFCLLMLFSTLVSYSAGLGFLRISDPKTRKLLLIAPITVDLLLLGFFKYCNMAISSWNWIGASWHQPIPSLNIVLPLGISFYTFHTITYIVDSYRGDIEPTRDFWEFASYVSLFSQLVAGPIVRFRELQDDLENIDRVSRGTYFNIGCSYFLVGLAQKLLLADTVASVIDPAFGHFAQLSTVSAWLCMLGYSYQLYFDFAGYSNMAIGLGFLFGMHIPMNFNYPYRALNPSDFWTRWHISLSRCLRDYLYIPLGGNRRGDGRAYVNLMTTMLIGGLWHGANWTFVAWGAYWGALLCFYRLFRSQWNSMPKWVQGPLTFVLAIFGWALFRATDWSSAMTILNRLLVPQTGTGLVGETTLVSFLLICALFAHIEINVNGIKEKWSWVPEAAMAVLFVICLAEIVGRTPSKFLYFQF